MDVIAARGEQLHEAWVGGKFCEDPMFNMVDKITEEMRETRATPTYESRLRSSWLYQAWLVLWRRCLIDYSRQKRSFLGQCCVCAVAGFIVGTISEESEYGNIAVNAFMMNLVTSILAMNASMSVYSEERLVYYREASVGLNRVSYWVGQNLSSFVSCIVLPWCFLLLYFLEFQPRGSLVDYWYCQTVFWFCIQSWAHLISVSVNPKRATIIGGVFSVMASLTCGFQPRLSVLIETGPGLVFASCNPARWALEGQWLVETDGWSSVYDTYQQSIADNFAWKTDNFATDMSSIIIISVVVRLLVLVALYVVNRNKQI
jgi:hypothetical protein